MNKYIYQSPKECAMTLRIIAEQIKYTDREETLNAIETAISYLETYQIRTDREKEKE